MCSDIVFFDLSLSRSKLNFTNTINNVMHAVTTPRAKNTSVLKEAEKPAAAKNATVEGATAEKRSVADEAAAAVKLQASIRRMIQNKNFEMRLKADRAAAVKLQASARRMIQYKYFNKLKADHAAAVKLQASARRMINMEYFNKLKTAEIAKAAKREAKRGAKREAKRGAKRGAKQTAAEVKAMTDMDETNTVASRISKRKDRGKRNTPKFADESY